MLALKLMHVSKKCSKNSHSCCITDIFPFLEDLLHLVNEQRQIIEDMKMDNTKAQTDISQYKVMTTSAFPSETLTSLSVVTAPDALVVERNLSHTDLIWFIKLSYLRKPIGVTCIFIN